MLEDHDVRVGLVVVGNGCKECIWHLMQEYWIPSSYDCRKFFLLSLVRVLLKNNLQ